MLNCRLFGRFKRCIKKIKVTIQIGLYWLSVFRHIGRPLNTCIAYCKFFHIFSTLDKFRIKYPSSLSYCLLCITIYLISGENTLLFLETSFITSEELHNHGLLPWRKSIIASVFEFCYMLLVVVTSQVHLFIWVKRTVCACPGTFRLFRHTLMSV